jgi:WD40 repeat protein
MALVATSIVAAHGAEPASGVPVNFADHVAPILKRHCSECHGESRKKSGLDLSNYDAALKGSNGGKVVMAGRPTRSRLLELITSEEDASRMPLGRDPVPPAEIAIIKTWIAEGLRENATSAVNLPTIAEFTAQEPAAAVVALPPASFPSFERTKVLRSFPALALATPPRASFFAVSGYECVDFINAETNRLFGSFSFPEGEPHVLRFNRAGTMLLVAGGRPVQAGVVALYEVRTGKRLATIGNEPDTILAADLSPDERHVAVAGSNRLVKVLSSPTGKERHTLVKHTDWVTALSFSPDGKLLATGDRVGNIYLWDPQSGQLTLSLPDHKAAIRALVWRADGKVLASCGEDGLINWWDVDKGIPLASQADAHARPRAPGEYGKIASGVLDAAFGPQGQLATCGRDRTVRLWDPTGKLLKSFSIDSSDRGQPERIRIVPTRVAIVSDGQRIVAGDSAGQLHAWPIDAPKSSVNRK